MEPEMDYKQEVEDHSHPDYEDVIREMARKVEALEDDKKSEDEKKEQMADEEVRPQKAYEQADFATPAGGDVEDRQNVTKDADAELVDTRLKGVEESLRRIERRMTEQDGAEGSFGDKDIVAPDAAAPEEPVDMMERARGRRTTVGRFSERLSPNAAIKKAFY